LHIRQLEFIDNSNAKKSNPRPNTFFDGDDEEIQKRYVENNGPESTENGDKPDITFMAGYNIRAAAYKKHNGPKTMENGEHPDLKYM
jgi:hypothetical protein